MVYLILIVVLSVYEFLHYWLITSDIPVSPTVLEISLSIASMVLQVFFLKIMRKKKVKAFCYMIVILVMAPVGYFWYRISLSSGFNDFGLSIVNAIGTYIIVAIASICLHATLKKNC